MVMALVQIQVPGPEYTLCIGPGAFQIPSSQKFHIFMVVDRGLSKIVYIADYNV